MSGWQLMKEGKSRIASSRVGLPLGSNSSSIPDALPQGSLPSKTPTPLRTTTGFSSEGIRPVSRSIQTSSNLLKPELVYRRPDALLHTRTHTPIRYGASLKETTPHINNNSITNTSTRSRQGPCSQNQSDVNVSVSSRVGLDDSRGGYDSSALNENTEGSVIGGTSESLVSNGLPYNKDLYVFDDHNGAVGEKAETEAEGSELTPSGQGESRRGSSKSFVGHTVVSSFFKGKSRLLSRSTDRNSDRRLPTPTAKLSMKDTQSVPSVRVASQRTAAESSANHPRAPRNIPSDLHQLSPAPISIVDKDAQSATAMGLREDSSLYSEINVRSTRALDAVRAQYSKLHEALRHRAFVREQCRLRGVDADDLAASLQLSSEPKKDKVKRKNIKDTRSIGTASSPLNGSFRPSSCSSASESVHGEEADFKSTDSEGTRYKSTLAKALGLGGKNNNANSKSGVKDSSAPLQGLDFSSSSGEEGDTLMDSVDRDRHAVPPPEVTDGDVSFELTAQHVQNLMRERTTRRQQRRQKRAATKARERQVRIMQLLRESHGFRELFEGIDDDYLPEEALEAYLKELKRRRRKRQEAEERAMVRVEEDGRRVYKDHVGSTFIPPTTVSASPPLSKHQLTTDSQSKAPHKTKGVVAAETSGGTAAAAMASVIDATEGISLVSGHDEQVQERIFRAAVPKLGPLPPPLPTDTSSEQTNEQHREYNALIAKLYTEPPTPRLTALTLLREKAFNSVALQALLTDIAQKQLIEDTRVRTRGEFESNEEEMRYVLGLRPRRISGGTGGKSSDQRKLMGFRSTTTDKTYRDLERRDRKAQRGGVSSSSSSSILSEDSRSSSSSSSSRQGNLEKSSRSLIMHGTSPRSRQRKPLDAKDYVHSFLDRSGANDLFEHRSEAEEAVRSIPPLVSSHRGNRTTQVSLSQIATRHSNDHGVSSQNKQCDEDKGKKGKKARRSSNRRGVEEGADDEDVCDVSEYLDETGIEEYTEERRRELNDLVFGNSVEELLKRLFKSYETIRELRVLLGKVQTQHAGYVTKEQDRYVEFMKKVRREAQERIDKAEASLKEIKERMARETRELTQRLVESESDAEKMRKANLASAAKSKESIDDLEKRVRELEASTVAIQTATTAAAEAHTVTVKDLRLEVEELTYQNGRLREQLDVSEIDNAFLTGCLQAVLDTVALPERCDFRGKPLSESFVQLQRRDEDEPKCAEKSTAESIPSQAQQYSFMFVPPSKAPLYTNGVPRILLNLPLAEYRLVRKELPSIGFSDGACQVDVVDLTGEKAPEEQLVELRKKLVASEQERGKLKAVEAILKETVITNTVLTERIERQKAEHERLTGVHKRSVQKMIRNIGDILLLKARANRQTRQLSSQRVYIKEIVDENEWLREKLREAHRKRQRKRPLYDLGSDTDVEVSGASGGKDANEYDIADACTQKSLDDSFVAGAFAYSLLSAYERAEHRANPQPSDFRLIPVSVIRHQASFGSSPNSRHVDIPTAKTILVKVSRYNESGTCGMSMQRTPMPATATLEAKTTAETKCTAAVAPPTPPMSSLLASTKGTGVTDVMSTHASPISASFRPPPLISELPAQTEMHEQLAPSSFVLSSAVSTTTRSTSPHPPLPQSSPYSTKFEATPMLAAYRAAASGSGDTPPKGGGALIPLSPSSPSLANLPLINRTNDNACVAEKQSATMAPDDRALSHARLLGWNCKGIQCAENDIELAMLGVNAVSNKARSKRMEELRSTLNESRGKTSSGTALKVISAVASMRTPSASSLSVPRYGSSKVHSASKKHSQRAQPQSLAEDINNLTTSTADNMSFGSSFHSLFAGVGGGATTATTLVSSTGGLDKSVYVSDAARDGHRPVDIDRNTAVVEPLSVSKGEGGGVPSTIRRPNTASSLSGKRVDASGRHASKALSRPVSASGDATLERGGGGKARGLSVGGGGGGGGGGHNRISLNTSSSLPSVVSRLGHSQFVPLRGETENVLHGGASQLEVKGLPPPSHDAEAILFSAPPTQFSILNNKVSRILNSQNNLDVSDSQESEQAWFEGTEKADGRRGVSNLPLPTGSSVSGPSGRAGHSVDDESFYNSHPLYRKGGDNGVRAVTEATAEALGGKKPRNMNAIGTLRQNPSRPFSASSLIRSSGATRISRAGPDVLTDLTMSSTSAHRSHRLTTIPVHSYVSAQSVLAPTSFPTTSELEEIIFHSDVRRKTVPLGVPASEAAVSHSSLVDDGGGVTFSSVSESSGGGKEGWAVSTPQNQTPHDPLAIAAIVRRHTQKRR